MAFTRKFLIENGVPEDKVDAIMAERNRTLSDYIPKTDVQGQIDTAIAEAQKGWKGPDVKETKEYKDLAAQLEMRDAIDSEDYATVKPKFRKTVYGMVDRSEGAKPIADQMTAIKEQYEEYFQQSGPAEPNTPQFGSADKGSMPQGNAKPSIEDIWFKK
jgi:hypothetical protein